MHGDGAYWLNRHGRHAGPPKNFALKKKKEEEGKKRMQNFIFNMMLSCKPTLVYGTCVLEVCRELV